MRAIEDLAALPLREFARRVGADAPAPGSGAAAAVTLALAAACAEKAFAISARHTADARARAGAGRAAGIGRLALLFVQRDAEDFAAWLKSRSGTAETALEHDGAIVLALGADLERLIEENAGTVVADLGPDLLAARDLLGAALAIERRNLPETDAPAGTKPSD